jgi:Ser/Thr protein kinase RdoA (MazF antagonist)
MVHADGTVSNMPVDGNPPVAIAMIDFTLGMSGPPESDISFALWVTGRSEQPAVSLDWTHVQAFVRGYHAVRPLAASAVTTTPLYLVGRGLRMLVRGERLGGSDQKVQERVQWLNAH